MTVQARRFEAEVGAAAPKMAVVGSRTGSELNQATRPFAEEDRAKSWRLLTVTLLLWAGAIVGTALAPWWPLKLVLSVLAGLVAIRWFIFYHDFQHAALLQDSKLASAIFTVCGFYTLSVRSVWRETHNFHHKNNAKLVGSAIGSFPVLTLGMWRSLTPSQRRLYRVIRHPLFIFGGYLTVFMLGMTFSPFKRDAKKHWGGPVAVLLHVVAFVAIGLASSFLNAFFVVSLPLIIALGAGSYLFFAQHNFPDMQLKDRRSWDYTFAALRSSSFFEMSPIMHWFTGYIGYHHVHHLNHRIPCYRLAEAMAAIPELQDPGRTSWKPSDVRACLQLAVWDPEENRMLTYKELAAHA